MNVIRANSTYPTDLVGEASYKKNISVIYNAPNRYVRGDIVFADAVIKLENDNKYDKNAVCIMVEGLVLGYLSRDDAKNFRRYYANNLTNSCAKSRVKIYQGTNNYGIKLDINLYDVEANSLDSIDDSSSSMSITEPKKSSSKLGLIGVAIFLLLLLLLIF